MVDVNPIEELHAWVGHRRRQLFTYHLGRWRRFPQPVKGRLWWQLLHSLLFKHRCGWVRDPVFLPGSVALRAVIFAVVFAVVLRSHAAVLHPGGRRGGLQELLFELRPRSCLQRWAAAAQGAQAARALAAHPEEHDEDPDAARQEEQAYQGHEEPRPPRAAWAAPILPHLPDALRGALGGPHGEVLGLVTLVTHVPACSAVWF
mmetsp:Transcript_72632/g.200419  ORF Transcript_72632/g.200419 Transcript_72632/m.200419 type:complete len:203 (+) Transcript_72632:587-1195(+)